VWLPTYGFHPPAGPGAGEVTVTNTDQPGSSSSVSVTVSSSLPCGETETSPTAMAPSGRAAVMVPLTESSTGAAAAGRADAATESAASAAAATAIRHLCLATVGLPTVVCSTHGRQRRCPFGSPAAVGTDVPVGPRLCADRISPALPFRGVCQQWLRRAGWAA